MAKFLKRILALIFVAAFLYSGWKLYPYVREYLESEAQYRKLRQYVSIPNGSPGESLEIDFDSLGKINPDIVAWIWIEDTNIHYPVVQVDNNDFYLDHHFDGRSSSAGCLFLDMYNDASFREYHQIIYGHNMKNHSMFHNLRYYKDQAYFDAHSTGWLITPSAVYSIDFFAGYISDINTDAWDRSFTEGEFTQWVENCKVRSMFSSNRVPDADSHVLTLSTCSYEFEDAKFVLHGVLREH